MVIEAITVVVSYALGTVPTAALVGRRAGFDPTAAGSKNPGATNAYRLGGRRAGLLVLVGDAAKGALAAGLGLAAGGEELALVCGIAAMVGHIAPVTRRFQGGKGVATAAGMLAVAEPVALVFSVLGFGVVLLVTRKASLASIAAAVAVLPGLAAAGRDAGELLLAAGMVALVVVRHAGNLRRLARGEEPAVTDRGLP